MSAGTPTAVVMTWPKTSVDEEEEEGADEEDSEGSSVRLYTPVLMDLKREQI